MVSGRRPDRDRVQHPRARPPDHLGGPATRLPGDSGRGAVHRRRLHAGQPRRGPLLPRLRPTREVSVMLARLARRKITLIGAALMAVMLVLGTLGPLVAGNPTRMDVASRLAPPKIGRAHV